MSTSSDKLDALRRQQDRWFYILIAVVAVQFVAAQLFHSSMLERGAFAEVALLFVYHLVGKINERGWVMWMIADIFMIFATAAYAIYPDWSWRQTILSYFF